VLNRPIGRIFLSWVSSLLVRLLLNWRIKDYSTVTFLQPLGC